MAGKRRKRDLANRRVCTYLTEKQYKEIIAIADERGVSLSVAVKIILTKYLKSKGKKK